MSFIAPSSPPNPFSTASSSPFHSPSPSPFRSEIPFFSTASSSPFHSPVHSPSFPSAGELQQHVWTRSSSSLQRSSRSSVPPSSPSMSGRSGYTGEGGDSIISWPRDDASSFTNDRIVHAYYAYPDYLLYDDKSAEWDAERLALKDSQHMLQLELAAQDQILSELELQLLAEKKMTKQIKTEKIKLEMDLAYEDHVIEELDLKFEEEKKMTKQLKAEKIKLEMDLAYHDQVIEELEVKIEQEKKMNADNIKDMRIQLEEKSAFALAATCVAITLFVVLVAIYAKL